MEFLRVVCENFFNFNLELNKEYDIIPALYNLIHRKQLENPSLFYSFDKRISRQSFNHIYLHDIVQLLEYSYKNIHSCGLQKGKSLQRLAQIFHATDKVDAHAREMLSIDDYNDFKTLAINKLHHQLEQEYGNMTRDKWYAFVISENLITKKSQHFESTILFISVALFYLYNKL